MSFGGVDEQKLANAAADRLPAILREFVDMLRELLNEERIINITIQIGGKKQ